MFYNYFLNNNFKAHVNVIFLNDTRALDSVCSAPGQVPKVLLLIIWKTKNDISINCNPHI